MYTLNSPVSQNFTELSPQKVLIISPLLKNQNEEVHSSHISKPQRHFHSWQDSCIKITLNLLTQRQYSHCYLLQLKVSPLEFSLQIFQAFYFLGCNHYRKISKMNQSWYLKTSRKLQTSIRRPWDLFQACFSSRSYWLPAWCAKRTHGPSSPGAPGRFLKKFPKGVSSHSPFTFPFRSIHISRAGKCQVGHTGLLIAVASSTSKIHW